VTNKALRIYAGPRALARVRERGLAPSDVRVIPAAAGGPKGLMLLALDRFLFGEWLPQSKSSEPIDLLGASIGAWRMAAACLNDPVSALERLEHDYIHQEYEVPPGKKVPTPEHVSEKFGAGIAMTFGGREPEVLHHPRYRMHIVTSRGRTCGVFVTRYAATVCRRRLPHAALCIDRTKFLASPACILLDSVCVTRCARCTWCSAWRVLGRRHHRLSPAC
jgi:hypothetical protein